MYIYGDLYRCVIIPVNKQCISFSGHMILKLPEFVGVEKSTEPLHLARSCTVNGTTASCSLVHGKKILVLF